VNLGSGISTVTAHSHGAGDTIRTRKTLTAGTILTLVVSAFLTGLVIPTGGKIIALFGAGTAAVAIGSAFFHRIAFFYPIFGLTTAFRGYLEGRGDLMYSSAAGLVSLAVRIIASYAMAPHFGNMTIAYAEMVSWVWLLVMYLFRLAAKKDDAL
jgi:Na+-driven multidrug efflux pump